MTMPDERARAIRWGREDLIKIHEAPLVSDEVKRETADILVSYPDDVMLESWIDGSELRMKAQTRDALLRARQMFEKIRMADDLRGTPELRRSLLFTLRHFRCLTSLSSAPKPVSEWRFKGSGSLKFSSWVGLALSTQPHRGATWQHMTRFVTR